MRTTMKLARRSIRSFAGRYIALLLIVLLSVGFYSGLRITKTAMANTCGDFLTEQNFYDFRLLSTLGFAEEDIADFAEIHGIKAADGVKSADFSVEHEENIGSYKLLSMPQQVNLPSVRAGRIPASETECLVDARRYDESSIGTEIHIIVDGNQPERVKYETFTIVGVCDSPIYLGLDRGATSIGNGSLDGFVYIPEAAFTDDFYAEVDLCLEEDAPIYSDEYEQLVEHYQDAVTAQLGEAANRRYVSILEEQGIPAEMAERAGIQPAQTYVLTREENAGYVSFRNDTSIVSGIASIFPVFFVLIAMLVCMTTMTRMVDEERSQIGVLKAMGYGNGAITAKYLLYAGSAALVGWGAGYVLGTWALPQVFWFAYSSLYDFAPLTYVFSMPLAVLTLAVSMIGILGSTLFSCQKELFSQPSALLRPKAAKTGKRILLEHITPLWSRLSFLGKISLRNMFRYKRHLIMMLVGISCCTALVVTAFGVRDSMVNIGTLQFEQVQQYDYEAAFSHDREADITNELDAMAEIKDILPCYVQRVDVVSEERMGGVSLYAFDDAETAAEFWSLRCGGEKVPMPENGKAVIGNKIADTLGVSLGDTVEIETADRTVLSVEISGVFDNYVGNYIITSSETCRQVLDVLNNMLLLSASEDTAELAERITAMDGITGLTRLSGIRSKVDSALSCLDYVVWMIVAFSGALAFIVIFNLTNINLAERSREIATVEVLGFYPKETERYVLRENLMLSVLAGFIGLPLGKLFHEVVMGMMMIDNMAFHIHVKPVSYLLALICTVFFAFVVNRVMRRQIYKIPMTESLKAVE